MPRILEGKELEEAVMYTDLALKLAGHSPCVNDKRGVVIVYNSRVIGKGLNAPPEGFKCEPEYCKPICKTYVIHAEMNAIFDAIKKGYFRYLKGSRLYHARAENEQLANSRKPRCADCSKHILEIGISEIVLKHEEGYTLYDVNEFHKLSLDSLENKI